MRFMLAPRRPSNRPTTPKSWSASIPTRNWHCQRPRSSAQIILRVFLVFQHAKKNMDQGPGPSSQLTICPFLSTLPPSLYKCRTFLDSMTKFEPSVWSHRSSTAQAGPRFKPGMVCTEHSDVVELLQNFEVAWQ